MYETDTSKVYQQAEPVYKSVMRKGPDIEKRLGRHLYDDEKLESMLRYFKIEDNYESLIKYIKSQGILDEDEE